MTAGKYNSNEVDNSPNIIQSIISILDNYLNILSP